MTTIPSDHTLDDQRLTDCGLRARGSGRLLLIACGALAREILSLIKLNGWDTVDVTCLPAILHNHPERITAAVQASVVQHRSKYDKIFIVYADCGTGGTLAAACADLGVEMVAGPHCYAFFDGITQFEARDEITSFYLTDFLARQFETFVWKPLGLDRHPELLPMYFGHYQTVVYLAQTEDPELTGKAQAAAHRMGLNFERRFTGYGDLARILEKWVSDN
ncbi:DUF1638 domain-containing protein [Sagittula sp. SSi028]|uniref:DUF1638 domain-containing protein n=1 Tax=Sagittula sp. SSi028 TaxID=3400636 RepID=UPI003AF98A1A